MQDKHWNGPGGVSEEGRSKIKQDLLFLDGTLHFLAERIQLEESKGSEMRSHEHDTFSALVPSPPSFLLY